MSCECVLHSGKELFFFFFFIFGLITFIGFWKRINFEN